MVTWGNAASGGDSSWVKEHGAVHGAVPRALMVLLMVFFSMMISVSMMISDECFND